LFQKKVSNLKTSTFKQVENAIGYQIILNWLWRWWDITIYTCKLVPLVIQKHNLVVLLYRSKQGPVNRLL